MSPIFVRPVREQLEHDRLIRFLQANKYKRKFETAVNIGDEQTVPVKIGPATFFPDLVLTAGKKLAGLVEVESGESVNNLEAMAQWVHFSHARVPFHLYVPVQAYDVARRLCDANQVRVAEIWTYRPLTEGFDLMRGFHDPSAPSSEPSRAVKKPSPKPAPVAAAPKPTAPPLARKPAAKAKKSAKPSKKAGRPAKPVNARKPAKPAKGAKKGRKR